MIEEGEDYPLFIVFEVNKDKESAETDVGKTSSESVGLFPTSGKFIKVCTHLVLAVKEICKEVA